MGFAYANSVGKVAKENPDVKFAIVDDASAASTGDDNARPVAAAQRACAASERGFR